MNNNLKYYNIDVHWSSKRTCKHKIPRSYVDRNLKNGD